MNSRPTSCSQEFFDALIASRAAIDDHGEQLSRQLSDEPWFFQSWQRDPTIKSVLTMLDAIQEQFAARRGIYGRLVQADPPYITFQVLNLKDFGLSDDLYIKMNGRGKPLTAFETFKAGVEQRLRTLFLGETRPLNGRSCSVEKYFSHRIDTTWTDLFWNCRNQTTNLFDDEIMHLARMLVIVTRDPDGESTEALWKELIVEQKPFSFFKFDECGCIDPNFIATLIGVLDAWCGARHGIKTRLADSNYFNEEQTFRKIISNASDLTYAELVQIHAYCGYIRQHPAYIDAAAFNEWMRVVRNLSDNTRYGGVDDFKRSMRSVNRLLALADSILAHLADPTTEVQGFDQKQIREERLKAGLFQKDPRWKQLILRAEQHGYFHGQVEFLLCFSGVLDSSIKRGQCNWDDADDAAFQQSFKNYFEKACQVFCDSGLRDFGEFKWERALLATGDYLLPKGSNYSFLDNGDRDASWKRLLRGGEEPGDFFEVRRGFLKALFDQMPLGTDIGPCLDRVIQKAADHHRIE